MANNLMRRFQKLAKIVAPPPIFETIIVTPEDVQRGRRRRGLLEKHIARE